MEFWKIYRLVKARRWMILGLLLITLLTVFVAKKAVDDETQYMATAVVLPDYQAMSSQGFFQDDGHGLLSATYSRFDRMAQFTQNIKGQFDAAATLAGKSSIEQKQAVVRALTDQVGPDQSKAIKTLTTEDPKTPGLEGKLNEVLSAFHVPTDDGFWVSRPEIANPTTPKDNATVSQLSAGLLAQPVVDTGVNTTPGAALPTPVITDYLQIGVHGPDPTLTAQIANLIAATFINSYYDSGIQDYQNSISTVQAAQADAKTKLADAQNALVDFKRGNPLLDVASSVTADVGNLVSLERSRDQALIQFQVAQKSATTYEQLAAQTGPTMRVQLDPLARPQVQRLQEQVADAQEQLNVLNNEVTPANPRYQRAEKNLGNLTNELNALKAQPYVSASPNGQYPALKAQANASRAEAARAQVTIAGLDAQIAQQQAQNKTLPEAEKKLAALTENESTADLNMRAADAAVAELVRTNKILNHGHITLTSAASSATPDTSGPSLAALLIYGAILSLLIGIAAAIGLDYLDNSVQTIPDAEKLLGMPVSAVIPAISGGDPRHNTRLIVSDPLSPTAESYRLLRTDLLFTAEQQPFQSLMAATAKPGQGATTTICNLAVALAAVGKRVILIDADLRRPKLHDFFGVSNEIGLTSLLRDECELEEALKVTDIDNLLVLPSGPLPLNPAELLASQKMRALHERLKPHTDFVLVDTPSAIAFSDSSILASYLDAVMIVVRAQETPRGSEMQLKNLLNKARANVVGVVLNGVKPQLVDSYVYHAAYYPQITTANGHALPSPNGTNGAYGTNGSSKTLEGDSVATVVTGGPGDAAEQDIERTVIMDDIVTVKPPAAKGRFNVRKMFGGDDRN